MVRKEIDVCDVCNNRITNKKCELCGADICDNCMTVLGIGTEENMILGFDTCKNCFDIVLNNDLKEEFENYPEIKTKFIEIFQRLLQLDELEGKTKRRIKPIFNIPTAMRYTSPVSIYPFKQKKRYPKK